MDKSEVINELYNAKTKQEIEHILNQQSENNNSERKTTLVEFQEKSQFLLDTAKEIRDAKNPVYALDNQDADYHENFRFIAETAGITPLQVWAVYALKHFTSVLTYAKNPDQDQPEDLTERFADLINYNLMGFSLYKETIE